MADAYQLSQQRSKQLQRRNKQMYDRKATATEMNPGDRVLVRNLTPRGGPGKLRAHWEEAVHIVVKKLDSLPVYEIRPENSDKPRRTIHRNLLLPCNFLPMDQPTLDPSQPELLPRNDDESPADDIDENDSIGSEENSQRPQTNSRPQRRRRPPNNLTYDSLGNPQIYQQVGVNSLIPSFPVQQSCFPHFKATPIYIMSWTPWYQNTANLQIIPAVPQPFN